MTTNQQTKTFTVPVGTRLSQGIELEFLVAYIHQSEFDPDEPNSSTLPPILRVAAKTSYTAEEEIQQHIRKTLRDHGICVREPVTSLETRPRRRNRSVPSHLAGHGEWDVGADMSISSSHAEKHLSEDKPGEYQWVGIELRSPACWSAQHEYDEVRFVVNLLKSKYRMRVNLSCGFHVHVGNGTQYFDARTLKRAAAFLFAADPMLSRLHAPWRRVNSYSRSIRHCSKLACCEGLKPAEVHDIVREVGKAIRDNEIGNTSPETLPVVPWSDQSREEKEFGGKEGWEQFANERAKKGPFLTISESLPSTYFGEVSKSPSPPDSDEVSENAQPDFDDEGSDNSTVKPSSRVGNEGGAYDRRFREFMKTEAFVTHCSIEFGHQYPDLLTLDEQHDLLFLVLCERMFRHTDLNKLSDSEVARIATACAPYVQIGRSAWVWDPTQEEYVFSSGQIGVELQHPRPLRLSSLNAEAAIAALSGENKVEDSFDKFMNSLLEDGPPSPSANTDHSLDSPDLEAFLEAYTREEGDSPEYPGELMPPSLTNSRRILDPDASPVYPPRLPSVDSFVSISFRTPEPDNPRADDESPVTSLPLHSNGPQASSDQKKAPKLQPHDIAQFSESYKRSVNREIYLCIGDWERIPWLPSPCRHSCPDPGEKHSAGSPDCKKIYCRGHPVTTTRAGIATVLGVNSGAAVGTLLVTPRDGEFAGRLNYDFRAYTPVKLGSNEESFCAKRTLEFREAGGSLDGEWIVTWARICVGIIRFCRDATPFEFMRVLGRIVDEEDRHRHAPPGTAEADMYDVCDLLEDICLFSEAASVRRREGRFGPPR